MAVFNDTIRCGTAGDGDTIDLTGLLEEGLGRSGLSDGVVTLFVPGSTAGLTTIEFEPGAVSDLQEVLEAVAPRGRAWRHHLRWGDANGHSHVRSALVGPSLSVPFVDGALCLGTWQQVVLLDFDDRPRSREVVAQFVGE